MFTPTLCNSRPQDGRPLTPSPRLRLQALGARRLLQLRRCGPSDAGSYSCAVGTARTGPVRLAVLGGYGALPGPDAGVGARAVGPSCLGTDSRGFQGEGRAVGVVGHRPPLPRPADVRGSAPERTASVLSELRSVRAREGDGATFECTVSEVEIPGSWELEGRPLRPGDRVRIRQEGLADFLPTLAPC